MNNDIFSESIILLAVAQDIQIYYTSNVDGRSLLQLYPTPYYLERAKGEPLSVHCLSASLLIQVKERNLLPTRQKGLLRFWWGAKQKANQHVKDQKRSELLQLATKQGGKAR